MWKVGFCNNPINLRLFINENWNYIVYFKENLSFETFWGTWEIINFQQCVNVFFPDVTQSGHPTCCLQWSPSSPSPLYLFLPKENLECLVRLLSRKNPGKVLEPRLCYRENQVIMAGITTLFPLGNRRKLQDGGFSWKITISPSVCGVDDAGFVCIRLCVHTGRSSERERECVNEREKKMS